MNKFQNLLEGGDLRSIGKANEIVDMIHNQADFDELFENLMATDRKIVMRAADAMEKIRSVRQSICFHIKRRYYSFARQPKISN